MSTGHLVTLKITATEYSLDSPEPGVRLHNVLMSFEKP